jgi:hypothetical protein
MSDATTDPLAAHPEADAPEVASMQRALDRGDHREARALAAVLVKSEDPALKLAGEAMAARFRRDPWIDAVFVGTGALMLFLAVHYLGNHG